MRTYADYLATMTVKTLNTIARDMGLKGYSKLRKAELITVIDDAVSALMPTILDTEAAADHDTIAALIAEVAVAPAESVPAVTFSAAPTSPMPATVIVPQDAAEVVSLEDLKDAYRNLSRTVRNMGGRGAEGQRRVKYLGMLRSLSAQLKAQGIKHPQYV